MDEISTGNTSKTTHKDASHSSGPGTSDSLLPVKQAPKAHHLPSKIVPAAINGGIFQSIIFFKRFATQSQGGMLCTLSGNLIPIARPPCKHPVDSFNFWWQVWTKYEMEIVPISHKRNHKRRRAAHRSPRLTAHRQSTHGNCRSG